MRGAEDEEGRSRARTPGADVLGPGMVSPAVADATGQANKEKVNRQQPLPRLIHGLR
jgi:hypothetical protein